MKRKYIVFIFALLMILITPSQVFARSAIATATAPGPTPDSEPMGKIILYDDYKIAFHYGYRVNNIVIEEDNMNIPLYKLLGKTCKLN